MSDLRAIGQVTGDEYSVYTLGGRRFVIRGHGNTIQVTESMAEDLAAGRYGRWSGHTHPPGYGLEPSSYPYDRAQIPSGQARSALWGDPTPDNPKGITIFHRLPAEDVIFQSERNRELMRRFYEKQQ